MTLTFTEARIQNDHGVWLCVKVNELARARQFVMGKQNRLYDLEITQHRDKRSLDANAYYWKLCSELAKAVGEKPDTIYRNHIREIGNYDTICIQKKALPDFIRRWKSNHLGRMVETRASKLDGCVTVLAYYGSSDFDRTEMSQLIDKCIQDCKAVGIEVMSEFDLSLIKDEWGK